MNRLSNYHYIAKHPSYSIWFTSQYPIPTGKIHNRIHRNPSPFTPIAQRSTTPSSALSHVSLADDESSAWIVCLSVCPPGSQSRLHTQGNWKLFGNTVDRLRPVNSFIHQPRPRLSSPPPPLVSISFFAKIGALASARERRLSGVRSANKSNTPRFVQRESSSFTIHEFIMGTTEDTAGPLLLIYRYASPGPIFLDARSWPREEATWEN